MKKKIIFIPIETYSREYQAKMALSALLVRRGYRVYLGHPEHVDDLVNLYSGIYFGKNIFKSLFPTSLETFHKYKSKNWSIIYNDEEGGIFSGEVRIWKEELLRRIDPRVLKEDDILLTWGEEQMKIFNEIQGVKCKVDVLGNIRFAYSCNDYLNLIKSSDVVSSDILFNLNYGIYNCKLGRENIFITDNMYRDDPDTDREYKRSIWLDQANSFVNTVKLILDCAKDNRKKIIVRPHPAEDSSIYDHIFSNVPNVSVTNAGSAIAWISKTKSVIHDGCTTGLEAYLFGKDVVNYRTTSDFQSSLHVENLIPNSVGCLINERNEILEYLNSESQRESSKSKSKYEGWFANFNQELNSFDLVANICDEVSSSKPRFEVSIFEWFLIRSRNIRTKIGYFLRIFSKSRRNNYANENNKFSGFSFETVERDASFLCADHRLRLRTLTNKLISLEVD